MKKIDKILSVLFVFAIIYILGLFLFEPQQENASGGLVRYHSGINEYTDATIFRMKNHLFKEAY